MTIHGIHPGNIPLTPAELIPLFAELSATRRARGVTFKGEDTEIEKQEDELYTILLTRLRSASTGTAIKMTVEEEVEFCPKCGGLFLLSDGLKVETRNDGTKLLTHACGFQRVTPPA